MARRRVGLPSEIRAELPMRANLGVGLDPEYPTTTVDRGQCKAALACQFKPSPQMLAYVREVVAYVQSQDGTQVRVLQDFRHRDYPSDLLLAWSDGPAPAAVAAKFAVSTAEDGTPRIPSWLSLRADNDFDLRWQPAF